MKKNKGTLLDVINGDYCVGCGACAVVSGNNMLLNEYGEYNPNFLNSAEMNNSAVEASCPFLFPELNEDVLANEFLDGKENFNSGIGFYNKVYAGFVKESNFRQNGTSGGMGTWIGAELMRLDLIDAVIHVKPFERQNALDPFYKYAVSTNLEEIEIGAKSKYHVVETTEVMQQVKSRPGRYLFIGVPCLVKAVRRLQKLDPILKERIVFTTSLVCGHFKSVNWTISLGWGSDISPKDIKKFQYRTKGDNIPARKYVFRATKDDPQNSVIQKDAAEVVGGKYNQGALMVPACNFCDDVVGETADLTIGDAWLPQFEADDNGTNLIIIRNKKLAEIFEKAHLKEQIKLTPISAEDAVKSQSGGFRQRREGLSYRIEKKEKEKKWYPEKRVSPGDFKISPLRKLVYSKRYEMTSVSREAFLEALKKNDYEIYALKVGRKLKKLRKIEVASTFFRSAYTHLKIQVLKRLK